MLHSPWALLLFLLLPAAAFAAFRSRSAAVRISSAVHFDNCPISLRQRLRPLLMVLRLTCIGLVIFALARPRQGTRIEKISTEGVAMMLTVDRSGSMGEPMRYKGQTLNRLEVVKRVAGDFLKGDGADYKGRAADMVGLVTYAGYADTQCPLVRGSGIVTDFLKQTQLVTQRSEDGTAIGDGIALAAARLQKAEAQIARDQSKLGRNEEPEFTIKSKVIVLLTDGINNAGQYNPLETAKMAAEWGIKIYTIGIGSPDAERGFFGRPSLDEPLLRRIADLTGGFYARADNAEQLAEIYKRIDALEKSEIKSVEYTDYAEQFAPWAKGALGLLLAEMLAAATIFRKIP